MSVQTDKNYYPQLDAIRGLSFLAVFFFHAYHPSFQGLPGRAALQFFYECLDYSIDVFFVLSSFLLTRIGINEKQRTGSFSFKKYFVRRMLRIWPLYYAIMLFSFAVVPFFAARAGITVTLPPPVWYLLFISNFYMEGHVYFLRFLWTLSVEEQFYMVLGVCLFYFQKHLALIIGLLFSVSIAYNVYAVVQNTEGYFHTLTYLFDFAAGSAAAVALQPDKRYFAKFISKSRSFSYALYMLLPLIFVIAFFVQRNFSGVQRDAVYMILRFIFIIYTAFFIIDQMGSGAQLLGLAKNKFLIYTGKISYGLYCFHGIVLVFGALLLQRLGWTLPDFLKAVLFLAVNFGVATLSYFYWEKQFLLLKNRFRRV